MFYSDIYLQVRNSNDISVVISFTVSKLYVKQTRNDEVIRMNSM